RKGRPWRSPTSSPKSSAAAKRQCPPFRSALPPSAPSSPSTRTISSESDNIVGSRKDHCAAKRFAETNRAPAKRFAQQNALRDIFARPVDNFFGACYNVLSLRAQPLRAQAVFGAAPSGAVGEVR